MASTDARPVPKKNVAYRHYFALRKNDGTLITTWAGQDSEVSKDGGNYADCTNEATEIQTSGTGYIDLTSDEMDADCVLLKVTVTNADALPYIVCLFPEENGDIRADVTMLSGDATAADILELFVEALKADTGQIDAGTFDTGAITAAAIAGDAITADKIADDAITADHIAAAAIVAATFGAGAIDATAIADNAITSAKVVAGDTGITLQKALEMLAAFVAGKATVSSDGTDSTITYYKRDGTSESFQIVATEADGARDATGQISGF